MAKKNQQYIKDNVNMYLSEKSFKLDLSGISDGGGKYMCKYSSNFQQNLRLSGNNLLVWGNSASDGYLSSLNTKIFESNFEINLPKIRDCTFLQNEHYIGVSQEDNLFIYNNQGVELHCVRDIRRSEKLEYLPYHYLLACVDRNCKIDYLDTSIGKVISTINKKITRNKTSKEGGVPNLSFGTPLRSEKSLYSNYCSNVLVTSLDGVVYLGNSDGTVTLNAPLQKDYLMKVNTKSSKGRLVDIKASYNKLYCATNNNLLKVFDIRNTFRELKEVQLDKLYKISLCSNDDEYVGLYGGKDIRVINMNRNGTGNVVGLTVHQHRMDSDVRSLSFNPYEDICAVTTETSLETLIFPQTADTSYDSRENSPFYTKKQRQEKEIRDLLNKIPADMICYNSEIFSQVSQELGYKGNSSGMKSRENRGGRYF